MSLFDNEPDSASPSPSRCGVAAFTVYGAPVPKGSVRAFKAGNRAIVVQTKDRNLRDWEGLIRGAAQRWAEQGFFLAEGTAVEVSFFFYFTRPKSKKPTVPMITRPDWDKVSRAVCDALQAVLFKDDCQITTAHVHKRYTAQASHVVISVQADTGAVP